MAPCMAIRPASTMIRFVSTPEANDQNTKSAIGQARLKLCRIVTVPMTFQDASWEQLRCIVAHDIELTLVSSPGPELDAVAQEVGAKACVNRDGAPTGTAG